MLDNYAVTLEVTMKEANEDVKPLKVEKLVLAAQSYTDAEKTTHQYFEDKLKDDWKNPTIKSIGFEKFDACFDSIDPDMDEFDVEEYGMVYKVKCAIGFSDTEQKRINRMILIRHTSIDGAIQDARLKASKYYGSKTCNVTKVEETALSINSPIFSMCSDMGDD